MRVNIEEQVAFTDTDVFDQMEIYIVITGRAGLLKIAISANRAPGG